MDEVYPPLVCNTRTHERQEKERYVGQSGRGRRSILYGWEKDAITDRSTSKAIDTSVSPAPGASIDRLNPPLDPYLPRRRRCAALSWRTTAPYDVGHARGSVSIDPFPEARYLVLSRRCRSTRAASHVSQWGYGGGRPGSQLSLLGPAHVQPCRSPDLRRPRGCFFKAQN